MLRIASISPFMGCIKLLEVNKVSYPPGPIIMITPD